MAPTHPSLCNDDLPTRIGGALVGRYRLTAPISTGAMAKVHEAVDVRTGEVVAMKILRAECRDSSEAVARFVREGRSLQAMRHPNIVRVVDHGVTEDGVPWIAMERLSGMTLAELLASGPLPEARAVRLMAGVARALSSIHAHRMIHRDVKPENIFVVNPGTAMEEAKLLDFGVAHVTSRHLGEHSLEYTRVGSMLGSIPFMAPELLDGKGREVTPAADVFSFGATLYEALVGLQLFCGRTIAEQLRARRQRASGSLAQRLADVAVAPELQALLGRMLSFEPAKRFSTGRDLVAALDGFVLRRSLVRPASKPSPGLAVKGAASWVRAGAAPMASGPSMGMVSLGGAMQASKPHAPVLHCVLGVLLHCALVATALHAVFAL